MINLKNKQLIHTIDWDYLNKKFGYSPLDDIKEFVICNGSKNFNTFINNYKYGIKYNAKVL
jgi:hypothetical protein